MEGKQKRQIDRGCQTYGAKLSVKEKGGEIKRKGRQRGMGYRGGIGIEMENIDRNMKDRDGGKEKSQGRKIEMEQK